MVSSRTVGCIQIMKWWTGQFSDSENRGSHTDDFPGTKLVNIVLLPTSISMSLWTISSPLRFHFSYILLLTKESAGAMEPTFSLWNIIRFSTRSKMPLTPLLGLVTEDNFLGLLNLQTFHSSSTWQGTLGGGGRQDYLQVACLQPWITGVIFCQRQARSTFLGPS